MSCSCHGSESGDPARPFYSQQWRRLSSIQLLVVITLRADNSVGRGWLLQNARKRCWTCTRVTHPAEPSRFVLHLQALKDETPARRQLLERALAEVDAAAQYQPPPPDAAARSEAAMQALLVSKIPET